ncbi:MAG: hypothetical protein JW768_01850 [Chitinispirillaceae bacterium]|nr:hypothetical protein [Chitinispirillaceae bacterium]
MNIRTIILLTIAACIAVIALVFMFPVNKTRAVEKLLAHGMAAIEKEDLNTLEKLISLYYKDELGFTYPSMRGNFSYVFRDFDDIRISCDIKKITTGKDTCVADVELWVRSTWMSQQQDMVGKEHDREPVTILCVREMLKWKVIGTRWPKRRPGSFEPF